MTWWYISLVNMASFPQCNTASPSSSSSKYIFVFWHITQSFVLEMMIFEMDIRIPLLDAPMVYRPWCVWWIMSLENTWSNISVRMLFVAVDIERGWWHAHCCTKTSSWARHNALEGEFTRAFCLFFSSICCNDGIYVIVTLTLYLFGTSLSHRTTIDCDSSFAD